MTLGRASALWVVILPAALVLTGLLDGPRRATGADPATPWSAHAPLTRAPDGRPLTLTFSSDFAAFVSDPGRDPVWRTCYGDGRDSGLDRRSLPGNGEEEVYVDPKFAAVIGAPDLDPFSLAHGALQIAARPAPPALAAKLGGRRFISGVISSQPSFAQRYGYFEARAKLPRGKGLWPALWLLPADMSWPPEIDIVESIGDPLVAYMSTHSKVLGDHTDVVRLASTGFHTFGLSWDARELVWYVDGVAAARAPTPPDMDKPMFFVANLAVGGRWPGAPDASTAFPAALEIAYVRIYRFGA